MRYLSSGILLLEKGLKPEPSKVEAIVNLERPDCKANLETQLGMVVFMSKIAPHLADTTAPLSSLLGKEVEFV